LVALHVRSHGHIEQLLRQRGTRGVLNEASVTSESWDEVSVLRAAQPSSSGRPGSPSDKRTAAPPGIVKCASLIRADQIPANRLLHWTRQHDEPWPGEGLDRY
jgi:hypothetical protein